MGRKPERHVSLPYRLPVTRVQLAGSVTSRTDPVALPKARTTVERTSAVRLDVVADERQQRVFATTHRSSSEHGLTAKWSEDGRLEAVGSTYVSGAKQRFHAVLSMTGATFVAAAALTPLGPVAAAGAALAAGAATAVAVSNRSAGPDQGKTLATAGGDYRQLTDADVGIHADYRRDHPIEAEMLLGYRVALLLLSRRHYTMAAQAAMSATDSASELAALDSAIGSARLAAERYEEHHRLWVASRQVATTTQYQHWWYIDDLPTEDELRAEAGLEIHAAKWWTNCFELRTAVSCDLVGAPSERDTSSKQTSAGQTVTAGPTQVVDQISYRPPLFADIVTWRLETERADKHTCAIVPIERRRLAVAHPAATTTLDLGVSEGNDTGSIAITIDPSGMVRSYEQAGKGAQLARAETLVDAPSTLTAAGQAGLDLATTLSPSTIRTAVLKQKIARIEQERLHDGLVDPATTDLEDLRDELAGLELESRIAELRSHLAGVSSIEDAVMADQDPEEPGSDPS